MRQAFDASMDGTPCVIRVGYDLYGFEKDRFAAQHFASGGLPIPQVLYLGTLDGRHSVCITEKIQGIPVKAADVETARRMAEPTFACWQAMQELDTSAGTGYGEFDANCTGRYESWHEFLRSAGHRDWTDAKVDVNEELLLKLVNAIERLARYCPEERHVVHCDFGSDNMLTDGQKITAVLDWEMAAYGDPLYDVAGSRFYGVAVECCRAFADACDRHVGNWPQYRERMLCYQLYTCVGAMHYYATEAAEASVRWVEGLGRDLLREVQAREP